MWYLIIAIALVCLYLWMKSKANERMENDWQPQSYRRKPSLRLLNREGDPDEDEWHTYIAGLPYHAATHDVGGFWGWIEHEVGNKYDRNAMAVYNSSGKLLGYIPAKEVSDYRDWCDSQPVPCTGYIYIEEGQLRGRVKALMPCNEEFLQEEFSRYLQWVNDNVGPEYVPKNLQMTF